MEVVEGRGSWLGKRRCIEFRHTTGCERVLRARWLRGRDNEVLGLLFQLSASAISGHKLLSDQEIFDDSMGLKLKIFIYISPC